MGLNFGLKFGGGLFNQNKSNILDFEKIKEEVKTNNIIDNLNTGTPIATSFTTGRTGPQERFVITNIALRLKRIGAAGTGKLRLSIRNANAAHLPTGINLCAKEIPEADVSTDIRWTNFKFESGKTLNKNTQYCIVLQEVSSALNFQWYYNSGDSWPGESISSDSGGWMTEGDDLSMDFKIYGRTEI